MRGVSNLLIFVLSITEKNFFMTTQEIFTALSYPDGVRRVGNGPDQHDAMKAIASQYAPNTKLKITSNEITVITKDQFRELRKERPGQCVVVDTQDGEWSDIFFLPM